MTQPPRDAEDPVDLIAAELPVLDLDELSAARIRRLALAELALGSSSGTRPRGRWRRIYRAVELAAVGGLAAGYLVWAVQRTLMIYR
jgi:hypothetical protein